MIPNFKRGVQDLNFFWSFQWILKCKSVSFADAKVFVSVCKNKYFLQFQLDLLLTSNQVEQVKSDLKMQRPRVEDLNFFLTLTFLERLPDLKVQVIVFAKVFVTVCKNKYFLQFQRFLSDGSAC